MVKYKKTTINPKKNDDKFFQYAVTTALNYQNIKNSLERISKIKPFIDMYNWEEISHHIKMTGKNLNKIIN